MRVRSLRASEKGIGKYTLIVFGALLGAGLFAAYHILPFYYYYFELQEHMQQLIRVANVYNDKELREKLRTHLKRMDIPASIDEVKIERMGNHVSMSLAYQEVFYLTWEGKEYEIYVFDFHAFAEGQPE